MPLSHPTYGIANASFLAAGGEEGIRQLVNAFYDEMDIQKGAKTIRDMHAPDLTRSRTRLADFLCGWLGGPRLYSQNYGPINIPMFHQHMAVDSDAHDAWLMCMQKAIELQPYAEDFKVYLLTQLKVPAARIKTVCANQKILAKS